MDSKRFLCPDPALAPGTEHAGFTVERAEVIEEASGTAYLMRHSSGARLIWLACDDDNRSFSIGFKTPPQDDTGVFHIIEHSVLDGSEKYPVKEPFVHLLKSSMKTFLNALTFPDKTIYPVASTNMKDLRNLMDVYLDAVFHPAFYQRPRIFEQEAWHYELDGEGADETLVYNGVVYNEMKGALSDPDDVMFGRVCAELFPDTAYGYESGGHPRAIPTLSYEHFLDSHARHYNLANSYTFLYGDMDIDEMLEHIAGHFARVKNADAGAPNPLEMQAPVQAGYKRVEMATAPENASVALGYVFADSSMRERIFDLDILSDALMGSNEAPLKRRLMQAGLGQDVVCSVVDGAMQPILFVQLKGAKEGVAQQFRELFEQTVAEICQEGIDRVLIDASLSRAEFTLREREFGFYTDGIAYAIQALSGWLYDDDAAFDFLHYEDMLTHAKEGLETDMFEQLLREAVCESTHSVCVELVPHESGILEEEAAELAETLAQMDEAAREHIREEVRALREEQETPDTPEALATLPRLSVADIGEGSEPTESRQVDGPIPCYRHQLDTNRVSYIYSYFDLDCVSFEELPYVTVLCRVLGKLGTKSMSAAQLDVAIEGGVGSLSFFTDTVTLHERPDTVKTYLVCGTSALSEKISYAASLPQEIWSSSDFSDTARILDTLTQQRIQMEQNFLNAGHAAALSRAASYFRAGAVVDQQLSGLDYYRFLKDLLANFDERSAGLSEKLFELAGRIFDRNNAHMSFTGSDEDYAAWLDAAGDLSLQDEAAPHALDVPAPQVKNEGVVTPGNVCYVGEIMDSLALGNAYSGKWQVTSQILSLDYLWNEIRVKGGAYGCGAGCTPTALLRMYSYRDPAVDPTLARYEAAGSWLCEWNPTQEDFEGYVISVVSSYDTPQKPRALARRADSLRLAQHPEDWREQLRSQALACTAQDVRAYADVLSHMADNPGICVFGARELLEASSRKLTLIDLMGN